MLTATSLSLLTIHLTLLTDTSTQAKKSVPYAKETTWKSTDMENNPSTTGEAGVLTHTHRPAKDQTEQQHRMQTVLTRNSGLESNWESMAGNQLPLAKASQIFKQT